MNIFVMQTDSESGGYDWFRYDGASEDDKITIKEPRVPRLLTMYKRILYACHYIIAILGAAWLFEHFIRHDNSLIRNVPVYFLIWSILIMVGSLLFIEHAMRLIEKTIFFIRKYRIPRHSQAGKHLFLVLVWTCLNYAYLEVVSDRLVGLFSLLKRIVACAIVTEIAYLLGIVLMHYCKTGFICRSLSGKLSDVYQTERILRQFKKYGYAIADSASVDGEETPAGNAFYIDVIGIESNRSQSENRGGTSADLSQTRKPAIMTKHDAMRLARDVFMRASSNGTILLFSEFSSIFTSERDALRAHSYFSTEGSQSIDRKTFREGILYFYRNRETLQRSLDNTDSFIGMVGHIAFIFIFFIILIVWLVIFGVKFRDLLALGLSSALAVNFIASGVLNEFIRNFIMLFSHQFDVGDEVLIDGCTLYVYNIGIAATAFLCASGGKIKFLNSDLWRKTIINISKAPEKIIVFSFSMPSNIEVSRINDFKLQIREYLARRHYDFYDNFILATDEASPTGLAEFKTSITLTYKGYKSKSKQFMMRAEFTGFLNRISKELKLSLQ